MIEIVTESFGEVVRHLDEKSFLLSNVNHVNHDPLSPPESVCSDSDWEVEFEDEEREPPFDHKTDARVREYHRRLHQRYNGMLTYLRKRVDASYWK
ncbi:hypothetical protein K493DRAFT_319035 [Basidiobolus meristosporus CBS 931.73]|uniref:Uncharacterized protein n=1 Tax=Basidiobolus meristosporus CBS 931.73 TaxID=1314790 RepID=A0A1Y1XTG8_9FUNG|nr:hypothetical protein K493DRAFT_319035 [Basidiobolus meristosporus CBS 931.73]|eukprot:ORX89030.1 hypothetical protein K493DRAFT_319035 [Basidiobolus meristosporus CBS 931.73]